MDLLNLQNGSDIRGIAISTEEHEKNLSKEVVAKIASGAINWYRNVSSQNDEKYLSGQMIVGIGRDSRISGPELAESMEQVFLDHGVQVIDFGLATTPAMFMATQFEDFDCDLTLMLTASHLPYYYNGIKFFTKDGGLEKEDIKYILSHTEDSSNGHEGIQSKEDLLSPYSEDMLKKIRQSVGKGDKPLSGLKIIVDAGNGAGGFFAAKVLEGLGADTKGSQFLDPDGNFPNHIPNPDNQEAMASIQVAVKESQADLGIIFDTDVDRSALVTASGALLNRNNLIAVLSQIILAEHPGTSIVTNSPTSSHLKEFIDDLGGKQVRYISGYRNVINRSIELNKEGVDSQLAIETSGHAAFKENYFLDDGAYVVAKILMLYPSLIEQDKSLDDLITSLKQPEETVEIRFKIDDQNFKEIGQEIIKDLEEFRVDGWQIDDENYEGIRINVSDVYGSGWFLLRMSLHEPLLVLQVENDQLGSNRKVLEKFASFINSYDKINKEKLEEYLN